MNGFPFVFLEDAPLLCPLPQLAAMFHSVFFSSYRGLRGAAPEVCPVRKIRERAIDPSTTAPHPRFFLRRLSFGDTCRL